MKKTKGILMISICSLALLLFGTKTVNATTTVNSEEELISYIQSSTEAECVLGDNITLTKVLTVEGYNKVINLNGKHLDSPNKAIQVKSVKLTINDSVGTGKYTCPKDYGIYAYDNGTVVVNGGTLESLDAVLTGNNTTGDMNFEVNGGTLTSAQGATIYMPGQVSLKITGGTLNGGINIRMGQITITGGTINNKNAKNTDSINEYYDYSGSVWYNSAIVFTTGTYTSENTQFGNSLNVKISGGTFNSSIGNALSVYGLGKVKQNVNISITGGKFNGKDADVVVYDITKESYVTKPEYKAIVNANKLTISGGSYAHSVKNYLADGYIENKTEKGYDIKQNIVLDYVDSKTGESVVLFESEKSLPNNYKLLVENKVFNNEESINLNKGVKASISKLYDGKKIKDTKIMLAYDISVSDGSQIVKIEGIDKYKISLKIDKEAVKDYGDFKVAYLDDNGVVKDILDAKLVDDNIEFSTNHLSTYAVIGYNTEEIENTTNKNETQNTNTTPQTGDNIGIYTGALLIAIVGTTVVVLKKNKMSKVSKH